MDDMNRHCHWRVIAQNTDRQVICLACIRGDLVPTISKAARSMLALALRFRYAALRMRFDVFDDLSCDIDTCRVLNAFQSG